jgi:cytochrome o ubiquinol oxidase subunit 2
LKIQVISLSWKWLFLYPEQGIATVNFVQIPVDTPVEFEMTADEVPMSSFWIPNLGGQLYTMTSHSNRLNLMSDTIGDYPGSTPEINGIGFAGMKFTTRVSSNDDFEKWAQTVKQSPDSLDDSTYKELLRPSESNPVALYSAFESDLYDNVIMKYTGSMEGHSQSDSTEEGYGDH